MDSKTQDLRRVQFDRDDVEILDDASLYQGFFQIRSLNLRHRLFRGGWGKVISRELFLRGDAVGVLMYDPKMHAVALVEQFRVGVLGSNTARARGQSPWLLELVAGIIEPDESEEDVAQRESLEETGTPIEQLEPIAQYFSSPGGSNEYFHLFAGKADLSNTGGVHGLPDEGEDIRVHVLSVEQCWQKVLEGELNNAHTLIAMQWLKLNDERLRALWS
jgi:ADP-ribose diphosphatase